MAFSIQITKSTHGRIVQLGTLNVEIVWKMIRKILKYTVLMLNWTFSKASWTLIGECCFWNDLLLAEIIWENDTKKTKIYRFNDKLDNFQTKLNIVLRRCCNLTEHIPIQNGRCFDWIREFQRDSSSFFAPGKFSMTFCEIFWFTCRNNRTHFLKLKKN